MHLSTDQLYDNNKKNKEADVTLTNNYTITKFQSEDEASVANAMIIMSSLFTRLKRGPSVLRVRVNGG